MKLMTAALKKKLPALYSQEKNPDPMVVAKFFGIMGMGAWTWYVLEGEETEDGDWRFFGLVKGFEEELGYFALSELQSVTAMGGRLPLVERDMYFTPVPLSAVRTK